MYQQQIFEIVAEGVFFTEQVIALQGEDRRQHPEIDERIEYEWQRKVKEWGEKGLDTSDRGKVRLSNAYVNEGNLILECGSTTFKEYIGTRDPEIYRRFGKQYLANTLGVQTILTTEDSKSLITVRGGAVEQGEGKLMTPGGYVDPSDNLDFHKAVVREVCEELLGDTPFKVKRNVAFGCVFDPQVYLNTVLCYNTEVDLTKEEVERAFENIPVSERENRRLIFFDDAKPAIDRLKQIPSEQWDPQSLGHINLFSRHMHTY